jgi:hypothetical protein
VRQQLSDGPKHGELVKAAAAKAEISERNLIAAAEKPTGALILRCR